MCMLDWLFADGRLDVLKSDLALTSGILNVAELALACVCSFYTIYLCVLRLYYRIYLARRNLSLPYM